MCGGRAILGIDAAWTTKRLSGVALVRETDCGWESVALTPSYEAFKCLAVGDLVDWRGRHKGSAPRPANLIQACRRLLGNDDDLVLVAVDMPMSRLPITGRRACDQEISREFGGRKCSTHSPGKKRPGAVGTMLHHGFEDHGYQLACAGVRRFPKHSLIEVYPHPAILNLMGLDERLPYKTGNSLKYWPRSSVQDRIGRLLANFQQLLDALRKDISDVNLVLPAEDSVESLAALLPYEAALDGLVCAWVGMKYLAGEAEPYGDGDAAIWVPVGSGSTRASEKGASGEESSPRHRTRIAGVCERDIDLLLLEEFIANPAFQQWFVADALGLPETVGHCGDAQRSVTQSNGESDLVVTFRDEEGNGTRLLIENKVNANLQPAQAERYAERAASEDGVSACYTVIVAPARYFDGEHSTKGFEKRVNYEAMLEWFEKAANLGARGNYKAELLRAAIEKGVLGYQPEADAVVTDFWHAYWEVASEMAPGLGMREPDGVAAGSGFVHFPAGGLPKGLDLCHKLRHGYVDLQLGNMGHRRNDVFLALKPVLQPGMRVVQARNSAAIRIAAPPLDTSRSFQSQADAARDGIRSADRLREWSLEHREVLTSLLPQPQ